MPLRLTRLSRLAWLCLALLLSTFVSAAPANAQEQRSLRHDGAERDYLIYGPRSTSAAGTVPLVIVLHGAGTTGEIIATITRFGALARTEGFYAVFPDGTGPLFANTWNARHCCGWAMTEEVDDVGFIAALIDQLTAEHPIDPNRVYVAGFSNGAMLAHLVGIELSDRVAAIAPVAGVLFGDEPIPSNPVPALIINNADDRVIPPFGREPGVDGPLWEIWDGTPLQPSDYQARFWAEANGCELRSRLTFASAFRGESYACPEGASVEYHLINDNRHLWPGGSLTIGGVDPAIYDATAVIWSFFSDHVRTSDEPELDLAG